MKYAREMGSMAAQVEGCSMIHWYSLLQWSYSLKLRNPQPCKKPFSKNKPGVLGSLEITQAPNSSSLQTKGVNQNEMVNFTDNKLLNEGLAWSATRSLQRTHSYTSAMDDYSPTWINEGHFWWNFPKQNRVGWEQPKLPPSRYAMKPSGRFWRNMESFWLEPGVLEWISYEFEFSDAFFRNARIPKKIIDPLAMFFPLQDDYGKKKNPEYVASSHSTWTKKVWTLDFDWFCRLVSVGCRLLYDASKWSCPSKFHSLTFQKKRFAPI